MLRAAKILSLNPAKGTMKRSSKRPRRAYFSHYLREERPDTCLIGDDIDSTLQEGSEDYRSVQISSSGEQVLIYDVNRAYRYDGNKARTIDQPSGQFATGGGDCDVLSCTTVDINKYSPTETEDKTVDSGILTQGREIAALFDLGDFTPFWVLKTCAQTLTLMSQTPHLFGAESSSLLSDVKSIYNRWKEEEESRNQEQTPEDLELHGYRLSTTGQNTAIIVPAHIDTYTKANSTSRSKQLKTILYEPDGLTPEKNMIRSSPRMMPSERDLFLTFDQHCPQLNPFTNDKISGMSNLKAAADDKIVVDKDMICVYYSPGNTEAKRGRADYPHIPLLPQCFPKPRLPKTSKQGLVCQRVEHEVGKLSRYLQTLTDATTVSSIRDQRARLSLRYSMFSKRMITSSSRDKQSFSSELKTMNDFQRYEYKRYLRSGYVRSDLAMKSCGKSLINALIQLNRTAGYGYGRPSLYTCIRCGRVWWSISTFLSRLLSCS